MNRLEFLENKLGDTVISSYDYSLDLVGNRRAVLEDTGRLVEYDYDALYRLTEEKISNDPQGDNRTIGYRYDDVGNREIKDDSVQGVTSYVYDDNDLLRTETLVKDGVTVYSRVYDYDDNGNTKSVTEDGSETRYSWDFENRLVGVESDAGDAIAYEYDSDGVRVSAAVNGEKTEFLVDKNRDYAQVLEEYVGGVVAIRYVHGLDLISQQQDNQQFVYLVDGLGSTRVLTDENGGVINTYTYEAFGELLRSTGTVENKYRFAGEQFDEDLEQYYLRVRFYNPTVGRFTRRDTYEGTRFEPITLHKYIYGNADPVNYIDPSGLFSLRELTLVQKFIIGVTTLQVVLSAARVIAQNILVDVEDFGGSSSDDTLLVSQGNQSFSHELIRCLADSIPAPEGYLVRFFSYGGIIPIRKAWLGVPILAGASEITNPISLAGFHFFRNLKLPSRVLGLRTGYIFGSHRVFGALGRANIILATGLLVVDASSLVLCTTD